jgi:hypothetical protein
MKRIITTIAIITALHCSAQKINFGIKAGLNMSRLTGGNADATVSASNGFHAGAFLEFKALGKIAIQPELLFSAQGAKFENDLSVSTTKMNYVMVPVMVKYYPIAGLFVEAGPQAGFLVTAKQDVENKITSANSSDDIKEVTKAFDMSANVGVGYDILDKVIVQVRYCIGLTNTSTVDTVNTKNGVFQMSLGYKF